MRTLAFVLLACLGCTERGSETWGRRAEPLTTAVPGTVVWGHAVVGADSTIETSVVVPGGVLLAGRHTGRATFGGLALDAVPEGQQGLWLAFVDSAGTVRWVRTIAIGPGLFPGALALLPNGNLLLGGTAGEGSRMGATELRDGLFLAHLAPDGTPLDVRGLLCTGSFDRFAVDAGSGDVFAIGRRVGTCDFGGIHPYPVQALGLAFVTRLSPEGDPRWFRELVGDLAWLHWGSATLQGLVAYDGGVTVAGETYGPLDLDGQALPYTTPFVLRFDGSGRAAWSYSSEDRWTDIVAGWGGLMLPIRMTDPAVMLTELSFDGRGRPIRGLAGSSHELTRLAMGPDGTLVGGSGAPYAPPAVNAWSEDGTRLFHAEADARSKGTLVGLHVDGDHLVAHGQFTGAFDWGPLHATTPGVSAWVVGIAR